MIPKIIHYCWFGENPLPALAIKCIDSWRKYFPDYEIVEWNEENFDINACAYVKEAYQAKKWAFVSDYARFKILYEQGGIYFDTDVEVIKSMEELVNRGPFMGCEKTLSYVGRSSNVGLAANPGLGLAANSGLAIYKEMLEDYDKSHFINTDGTYNYKTVVNRMTEILKKDGFIEKEAVQIIKGVYIYPSDYFCPLDYLTGELDLTDNTHSIHWYDASWQDDRMRIRRKRTTRIMNMFSGDVGKRLGKLYMTFSYYWEWIATGQFSLIKEKIIAKFRRN